MALATGIFLWLGAGDRHREVEAIPLSPPKSIPPTKTEAQTPHEWQGVRVTVTQEGSTKPLDKVKLTLMRVGPPGALIDRGLKKIPARGFAHNEGLSNLLGQLTLPDPGPGSYFWKAQKEGWASVESGVFSIPENSERKRFEESVSMPREATLQLTLRAQGRELPLGANALLLQKDAPPRIAQTDSMGNARWNALPPGAYWLFVEPADTDLTRYFWPEQMPRLEEPADFVLAAGETIVTSISHEGKNPAALFGSLKVNDLPPEQTFEVVLHLLNPPRVFANYPLPLRTARVETKGVFEIRDLCPGRYRATLRASAIQVALAEKEMTLAPGNTETLDFSIETGFFRGQVIDEKGQPIPQCRVVVRGIDGKDGPICALWTDAEGGFRTWAMPLRRYEVKVYPLQGSAWEQVISLKRDENSLGAIVVGAANKGKQ